MTITRLFSVTAEGGTGSELTEWDSIGTQVVISATKKWAGTYSYRAFGWRSQAEMIQDFTATAQVRGGFYINHIGWAVGTPGLISFYSGASTIIAVVTVNATTTTLKIGSVTVASVSTGAFTATDTWFRVGIDLKIAVSGWFNLYIDGTLFLGFTGDTSGAGASFNAVRALGGVTSSGAQWAAYVYVDALYMDDSTGEVAPALPPVLADGPLKAGGNVTVTLNSIDITIYIDNARLDGILKTFQSTVFSSAAHTFIPTTGAWAFPLGGKWDIVADGILFPIVSQKTEVPFVVTFDTVNYTWTAALLVDYRVEAPSPRDAIQWMAAVAAQGAPVRT